VRITIPPPYGKEILLTPAHPRLKFDPPAIRFKGPADAPNSGGAVTVPAVLSGRFRVMAQQPGTWAPVTYSLSGDAVTSYKTFNPVECDDEPAQSGTPAAVVALQEHKNELRRMRREAMLGAPETQAQRDSRLLCAVRVAPLATLIAPEFHSILDRDTVMQTVLGGVWTHELAFTCSGKVAYLPTT
jgi:hypothetical protein